MSSSTNVQLDRGLVRTDSVSDRRSDADHVAGTVEIGVVQNVVEVCFRTHKDVSPDVVTDSGPDIYQEMVRAGIAVPVGVAGIGRLVAVEPSGLPSDTTH